MHTGSFSLKHVTELLLLQLQNRLGFSNHPSLFRWQDREEAVRCTKKNNISPTNRNPELNTTQSVSYQKKKSQS